jgi:hypothetical protein
MISQPFNSSFFVESFKFSMFLKINFFLSLIKCHKQMISDPFVIRSNRYANDV